MLAFVKKPRIEISLQSEHVDSLDSENISEWCGQALEEIKLH